jgi:hypothetical protein
VTDAEPSPPGRRRKGRNEAALDLDLAQHTDLAKSVRSSLRTLAALLDQAEGVGDVEAGSRVAHEFHDQLAAAGIAVPPIGTVDTVEEFLRLTSRPTPGSRDVPDA